MIGKLFFTILILLLCMFISTRISYGTCPYIQTVQNFTAEKYVGKWYEIQRYPMIFETGQKCITATYSLNPNGSITVLNAGVLKWIDYPVSVTGLATPNAADSSKLTVKFGRFGEGKYWVIDTDYVSYSLVYSCSKVPVLPFRLEYAWILSRKPTLDPEKIKYLKKLLSDVNSSTNAFQETQQTDCNSK